MIEGKEDKITYIGANLKTEEKAQLTHFLRKNVDVFAWRLSDMLGISPSIMCHNLGFILGRNS